MNCYLVDYENIGLNYIDKLEGNKCEDTMIVFYSKNSNHINFELLDDLLSKFKYKSFNSTLGIKNALDFQLSSYLGFLIGYNSNNKYINNINYYIISDDKGYEVVADFWTKQGQNVKCLTSKDLYSDNDLKENIDYKVTINELRNIFGDTEEVFIISKIFNKNDTKQQIHNALQKYYRNSNKTSKIYNKLKTLYQIKNKL